MAKQIYLVVFLISFSGISRGENYLKKEQHNFVVRDMNGFVEEVLLYGFSEKDDVLPIYFNSLYRISDIILYTSTDDITWEKQKTKNAVVEDVTLGSFYDGNKKYNIVIAERQFYKLSYTIKTNEIILLSSLGIRNTLKTDSIINTIQLDAPLVFSYLNPPADSTFRLLTDSSLLGSEKIYRFISVYNKKSADKYTCYKEMYCIIHLPGKSPEVELNSWLKNLYKTTDGINQQTTDEINKITGDLNDSLEMTRKIFEYVKHKIDYIDIEAAYGAWCPRKADDILIAHKGDCKDMANLVYQMLKYKKIRCYMAIMPTLSHPDDFLFPSMASANHAICVAYVKNNWYFLDATDNHNFFDLPSRHSQGRTVFCVTDSVPFLMKIPVVSPEKNKTSNTMNINISDTAITGSWDIAFNGHRAVEVLDLIKSYAKEDIQEGINNHFKNQVPKLKIISTTYEIAENGLVKLHADFFSPVTMVSNSDGLHYISLNYLPKPSSNSLMESGCHHFMFSTIADTYHITYHFTKPVKIENTINVKSGEQQIQFEMKLQQNNEREVTLQYSFQNPYLEYDEQLYDKQQAFMAKINKTYNNQIIYE